ARFGGVQADTDIGDDEDSDDDAGIEGDEDLDGGEDIDDDEDIHDGEDIDGEDDDVLDAGVDAGEERPPPVDAAVTDAGVADVIDLPPLPDSPVPIDPPGLPH